MNTENPNDAEEYSFRALLIGFNHITVRAFGATRPLANYATTQSDE